jgi:hypothetical protein
MKEKCPYYKGQSRGAGIYVDGRCHPEIPDFPPALSKIIAICYNGYTHTCPTLLMVWTPANLENTDSAPQAEVFVSPGSQLTSYARMMRHQPD